jgi:hypothetical protein
MKHWLLFVCLWLVLTGCCPPGEELHGLYAVTGEIFYSVPGLANGTLAGPQALRLAEGTTSDLRLEDPEGRCSLRAEVETEALVLAPGPVCAWTQNGVHFLLTLTQGRVRLTGGEGRFDMVGRVTATAQGRMLPGTFLQNATLARVGD